MWLLKYGLNQAEIVVTALLETAAAEDDARRDAAAAVQMPDAVPLLDDLSALSDPDNGLGEFIRRQRELGASVGPPARRRACGISNAYLSQAAQRC